MGRDRILRALAALVVPVLLFTSTRVRAQAASAPEPPTVPEQVAVAFRFGDFAELERLYAIYGKAGVRSPLTGASRVGQFWNGIGEISSSNLSVAEAYYVQMDAMTRKWTLDHPASLLARLLYANSLSTHAWFLRGGGFADTVSQAGWAGFGKYLDQCIEVLRASAPLAARDSSWDDALLLAGRGRGWSTDKMRAVFEDGVAKNPDDDDLYFAMETDLLPKWGGSLEEVERFIASVTARMPTERGLEMYASMYAALSYEDVAQTLFTSTHVSWPKMKAGFEGQLARYPHVDHRNRYAYFACMANDRQVLAEQLRLIGDGFNRAFWGSNPERNFAACQAMARQAPAGAPPPGT